MKNIELQEKLLHLIEKAKIENGNNYFIDLGKVSKKEALSLFPLLKIDVTGYIRTIDLAGIKHVLKKHPNINIVDFLLIPLIVKTPNFIGSGKYTDTIVYRKTFMDEYYYVECIRSGRKKLVLKTFYKRKNRLGNPKR